MISNLPKSKGGRPKNSKAKSTKHSRKVHEAAYEMSRAKCLKDRQTPMEFLERVFNDPNMTMKDRINAAKELMPYCHGKKPIQAEISGRNGGAIEVDARNSFQMLEDILFEGIDGVIRNETDSQLDDIIEYSVIPKLEQANNAKAAGERYQTIKEYDATHDTERVETKTLGFYDMEVTDDGE